MARTVTVSRWMLNIDAPPFWLKNMRDKFPGFEGKVDRWQIITFQSPSTISIDVGVAKAGTGAPEGDRSQGVNGYVMNTITPETAKSCHYFWAFMRNYRLDSQLITTQLRNGVHGVFGEDEAMLKAQQEAIDANPDYEFYNLNIDAGGMWVRRLIERQLAGRGPPRRRPSEPRQGHQGVEEHGSNKHTRSGRPATVVEAVTDRRRRASGALSWNQPHRRMRSPARTST